MEHRLVDIHTHHQCRGALTISCVGYHPWDAEQSCELGAEFKDLVLGVDAVGEIGLDYATDIDREAQRRLFVEQLKMAKKCGKPVVLHVVRAFDDVMQTLSTFALRAVIFHGFIGSLEQMNRALERGYYISFGARTFASPKSLRALRDCPLDRLFFESDMADIEVEQIYRQALKYRIESYDELVEGVYNNYIKLFAQNNG